MEASWALCCRLLKCRPWMAPHRIWCIATHCATLPHCMQKVEASLSSSKLAIRKDPALALNLIHSYGFASLPATLQMGLNSNNVISKICNEIECGCQLAELHKLGYSLADSLKRMKTTDNHCQPYLDAISHYVSRYSGGTDMPLMAFLGKWGFLFEWYLVLLFPPSTHVGSRYFSVQACWLKTLLCASLLATWFSIHKPFKNIFVGLLPPNTTSSSQESCDVHSSLVRSL